MSATVTEPTLHTELWHSFVSMLRSYAAAASLNSGAVLVSSIRNTVTITVDDTQLEMNFDPCSARINWRKRTAADDPIGGSFDLLAEGAIAIDGATKDLDHVAIEFVALVTAQGKGSRR